MKKITSNKISAAFIAIMIFPFVVFSFGMFFHAKNSIKNTFIESATRFNLNTANQSIDQQIGRINTLIKSLTPILSNSDLDKYISPTNYELNSIIPIVINTSTFFKDVIISNASDEYRIYPASIHPKKFKPSERPWFSKDSMENEVVYTDPYVDISNDNSIIKKMAISVSMNIFEADSTFKGNIAFDLDLKKMSQVLNTKIAPYDGTFEVVSTDAHIVMFSDKHEVLSRTVPMTWIEKSIKNQGYFYDAQSRNFIFYYKYNNPDWVAFTIIDKESYDELFYNFYYFFFPMIALCLCIYLIVTLLFRIYLKQIASVIFMQLNGLTLSDEELSMNGISSSIQHHQNKLATAESVSMVDFLTQSGTRRKFDKDINNFISHRTPFCLAMLDLDNFKKINDGFGHQTGDIVLQTVCQTGSEIIDGGAFIYRFGGEEIAIVFPGTNIETAYNSMDEWRRIIFERKWRESDLHVSFSCGITEWKEGDTADLIIEKADKLLYKAKDAGKNCIVV